jgi:hypothetical protein
MATVATVATGRICAVARGVIQSRYRSCVSARAAGCTRIAGVYPIHTADAEDAKYINCGCVSRKRMRSKKQAQAYGTYDRSGYSYRTPHTTSPKTLPNVALQPVLHIVQSSQPTQLILREDSSDSG